MAIQTWPTSDEHCHRDVAVEAWWFWGASSELDCGVFVGLELRGQRYDYWAGLVRVGQPYLYIEELDGNDLRSGLEIKPSEMWADHVCDDPFQQWSVSNEAHGVLLDDPTEAWRRAYGDPVPATFDIEWYASALPAPLVGPGSGYSQAGEIDCQIELLTGLLAFTGPARRMHCWGAPHVPLSMAMPVSDLRAPYRRSDGVNVDQVLTDQWWCSRAL